MRSIDACQGKEWSILTWNKADGGEPSCRPFACRSWRHEGDCRQECGACDFARICVALEAHQDWTYCVFTYPRFDWPDPADLFRFGVVHWSRLRKRLITRFGKILYIQTWEIHRSGWPHVNVVISNHDLYELAWLQSSWENPEFMQELIVPVGFGMQCWVEPMRSAEAMGGYLTKLGMELTGAGVKNQVPVNAPRHFRRIRATRKLLPPRTKNPEITGQLFKICYDKLLEQLSGEQPPTTEIGNERDSVDGPGPSGH